MAVKLIIDSASDINKVEANEKGIILVPMVINFGVEEFLDGETLMPTEFFDKLANCKELPKTSQISAFAFEEIFDEVVSDGDEAVVITLSSKLSGTNFGAVTAAKKYPDKIFVVDSLSAATGERLLLEVALKMVKEGFSAKQIKEKLDELKKRICIMAVVETLEYLKKGGRISSAVAFVGGMLSIKPIVALIDGEVKMIGKAMGMKKALKFLTDTVVQKGGVNYDMPFGAIWSGRDNGAVINYVKDNGYIWKDPKNVPTYQIGSTIGTHVGPGVVGVAFFTKE